MSVFKYRMQNILNIKEKLEEQAKNEFAAASRRVLEEQEKLSRLQDRNCELERRAQQLLGISPLDVQEILMNKNGIVKVKEQIKEQEQVLSKAEEILEDKRIKLMEVRTERKTHEILKENAFMEFLQEEKAEEGKEIDQLTSYTYGRKLIENK